MPAVEQALKTLNFAVSDGFLLIFCKICEITLSVPVTAIFKMIKKSFFKKGEFPSDWKIFHVVVINKKAREIM